ncbi:FliO/MopB family protein [Hyphococcus sp.]|jgi:flagellar protein FliO/FliZ|uniref:FliO/MopB family protein n=1 Tax=Hyphococcus sp. TaxID=2038636 RepID=UPI003D146BA2
MLASEIVRVVFSLAIVLGMIGAFAYLARKAGFSNLAAAAGKKRRLSISETLPLDARRRLAIVRCDDLEYLIVLGPSGETIVASGLEPAPAQLPDALAAEAGPANNLLAELGGFAKKLREARAAAVKRDAA